MLTVVLCVCVAHTEHECVVRDGPEGAAHTQQWRRGHCHGYTAHHLPQGRHQVANLSLTSTLCTSLLVFADTFVSVERIFYQMMDAFLGIHLLKLEIYTFIRCIFYFIIIIIIMSFGNFLNPFFPGRNTN